MGKLRVDTSRDSCTLNGEKVQQLLNAALKSIDVAKVLSQEYAAVSLSGIKPKIYIAVRTRLELDGFVVSVQPDASSCIGGIFLRISGWHK